MGARRVTERASRTPRLPGGRGMAERTVMMGNMGNHSRQEIARNRAMAREWQATARRRRFANERRVGRRMVRGWRRK